MQSTYELVIDDDAGIKTIVPLWPSGLPEQSAVSIGRKTGNVIRLSERNVSRHHARLVRAGDALGIEDLGSYTGVLVNGQRIAGRATLDDGDQVQIGEYRMALRRVAVVQTHRVFPEVTHIIERRAPPVLAPQQQMRNDLPAPPRDEKTLPPAASLAPRASRGAVGKRRWGVSLGVGLVGLFGAVLAYHQTTAPEVTQQTVSSARAIRTTAPPKVRTAVIAAPTSTEPKEDKSAASPAPVAATTPLRSNKRSHERDSHLALTAAPQPAGAASLTAAQATELLDAAQAHYVNGEFAAAIREARQLQSSQGVAMTKAWRIMGAAACKLGNFELGTDAYRHVDVVSRQYMLYVCQQSGATLSSGHFVAAR